MFCANCGQNNDASFKFCDSCGAPLVAAKVGKTSAVSQQAPKNVKVPAAASAVVTMQFHPQTWAGLRWLLATNYGVLTLTETHLNHEINRFWASDIYSIIVKIFSWGFDLISSLTVGRGATALKSISTARILSIDWIIWKGHFIFIWAGGLPDIYIFSTSQLAEANAFVEALQSASVSFKYNVAK